MKCKSCGKDHKSSHIHFKVVSKLSDKGFPTHSSHYQQAHKKANKAEKEKFGVKQFKKLEKIDKSVRKHELVGKNLKNGKIEISKKVPASLRNEVAYHEKVENKNLRSKKK